MLVPKAPCPSRAKRHSSRFFVRMRGYTHCTAHLSSSPRDTRREGNYLSVPARQDGYLKGISQVLVSRSNSAITCFSSKPSKMGSTGQYKGRISFKISCSLEVTFEINRLFPVLNQSNHSICEEMFRFDERLQTRVVPSPAYFFTWNLSPSLAIHSFYGQAVHRTGDA